MAELAAFLARAGRTPFVWGEWDCSLWLADWLVERGYPDPAAHLRGRYHTALGCARILGRLGGVEGAVASCAAIAGLARAPSPRIGDVGVVKAMTPAGARPVGAICTGRRWAVLAWPNGLHSFAAVASSAWRV